MENEEYEPMEIDTRSKLAFAVSELAEKTIDKVMQMIRQCGESPTAVRNRHEAYGIAAEHYAKVAADVKSIKNDCGTLLGTLADPNFPAVEATSAIVNSTTAAAKTLLVAAAEMRRTLENLYLAESRDDTDDRLPIDDYIDDGEFEEVEEAEKTEE